MKSKVVWVRITERCHKKLKHVAGQQEESISAVIRGMIKGGLDKRKVRGYTKEDGGENGKDTGS